MPSLLMFVRERLAEDDEAVRRVFGTKIMADLRRGVPPPQWVLLEDGSIRDAGVEGPLRVRFTWPTEAGHILRHQPARVLQQTEALRTVVDLHGIVHREIGWLEKGTEYYAEIPVCGLCVPRNSHYRRRDEVPEGPCPTLRSLASIWSDHPDFSNLT